MDRLTIWLLALVIGFVMGVAYTFAGCASWGGCDYPDAPHRTDAR